VFRSFNQLIGDLNELRYKDYGDEARGAHRYISSSIGDDDNSQTEKYEKYFIFLYERTTEGIC